MMSLISQLRNDASNAVSRETTPLGSEVADMDDWTSAMQELVAARLEESFNRTRVQEHTEFGQSTGVGQSTGGVISEIPEPNVDEQDSEELELARMAATAETAEEEDTPYDDKPHEEQDHAAQGLASQKLQGPLDDAMSGTPGFNGQGSIVSKSDRSGIRGRESGKSRRSSHPPRHSDDHRQGNHNMLDREGNLLSGFDFTGVQVPPPPQHPQTAFQRLVCRWAFSGRWEGVAATDANEPKNKAQLMEAMPLSVEQLLRTLQHKGVLQAWTKKNCRNR